MSIQEHPIKSQVEPGIDAHALKEGVPVERPTPHRPSVRLVVAAVAGVVVLLGALLVVLLNDNEGKAPVQPAVSGFGAITSLLPANSGASVVDAVAAPNGDLFFATQGASNAITKLSPSGQLTTLKVPGTGVGQIVVATDGTIYTSTLIDNASTIVRMAPDGTNVRLYTVPSVDLGAAGKRTQFPIHAIALGPDGTLWFERGMVNRWDSVGGYTSAIGRLSSSGKFDIYPLSSSDRLYAPGGIAVGPNGKVYFSETCVCARRRSQMAVAISAPASSPATTSAG